MDMYKRRQFLSNKYKKNIEVFLLIDQQLLKCIFLKPVRFAGNSFYPVAVNGFFKISCTYSYPRLQQRSIIARLNCIIYFKRMNKEIITGIE